MNGPHFVKIKFDPLISLETLIPELYPLDFLDPIVEIQAQEYLSNNRIQAWA